MASPPAEPSPSSSQGSFSGITLDALVEYFLASKRSLTAIQHVVRAQEIVVAGREALEENARLAAKNGFVENALNAEVQKLEALAVGIGVLGDEVGAEFEVSAFAPWNQTSQARRHTQQTLMNLVQGYSQVPRSFRRTIKIHTPRLESYACACMLSPTQRTTKVSVRFHR